jgi:hypothetical protein
MLGLIRSAQALGLAAVTCLALGTAQDNAGSYTLTKIAEVNSGFVFSQGDPAINNGGTVVFGLANNSTGEPAIFTGNGGTLTRVADNLDGVASAIADLAEAIRETGKDRPG